MEITPDIQPRMLGILRLHPKNKGCYHFCGSLHKYRCSWQGMSYGGCRHDALEGTGEPMRSAGALEPTRVCSLATRLKGCFLDGAYKTQ